MLDSQYFLQLLQFVGETSREQIKDKRQQFIEERRKYYEKEQWAEYEACIGRHLEVENAAA